MEGDQLPARRIFDPTDLASPFKPVNPDDIVAHFLSRHRGATRKAYGADLKGFAAFFGIEDPRVAVSSLLAAGASSADAAALAWVAWMQAKGLRSATIARRLTALKSVVDLARILRQIDWSIEVRAPKVEKYRDTRGPGLEAVKQLLGTLRADRSSPRPETRARAIRDTAIVRLLYDLGLRRGEVVSIDLHPKVIELAGDPPRPVAFWTIRKGKTDPTLFELPTPVASALGDWLDLRGQVVGPLFTRLDPGVKYSGAMARIGGPAVLDLCRRLGIRSGCVRPVRPHGLRHSSITRLVELGNTLADVQQFSGHANIATLQKYLDQSTNVKGKLAASLGDDLG